MTLNQPLSLFISSKMTELADERRAVQAALKKYNMYGWLWEHDVGARIEPIRSAYLTEVAACDIYIGLFWLEYGPCTIEESKHAYENKGKPCLLYEKSTNLDQRDPLLEDFLAHIRHVDNPNGLTVCRFETPKQLAIRVQKDIMGLLISTFRRFHQQFLSEIKQFEPITSLSEADKYKNIVVNVTNVNIYQSNTPLPDNERYS